MQQEDPAQPNKETEKRKKSNHLFLGFKRAWVAQLGAEMWYVCVVGWLSEQDLALPCPQATDWAHWGCEDMPQLL